MKNVHKIRGKREFLFDDKDLIILTSGALIICALIFVLGFMVGASMQEQSVASPLTNEASTLAESNFSMTEESTATSVVTTDASGDMMPGDTRDDSKKPQRSYYQVLPDSQTYVEVDATPTQKPVPTEPATQETGAANAPSQESTAAAPVKEETPIPPPQNTPVESAPPRQTTAAVPALPNVPKSPTDEIRVGRQSTATAPSAQAPLPDGTVFSVQVASSTNLNDSETLRQKYGEHGYQAYVMSADLGEKGIWYRVRVGNLTSKEEAERLRQDILNNVGHLATNPYVIQVTD